MNNVRDTVDSVGLIPRRLPFTQVDNDIRYFRHALSLDKHLPWVDISFVILKNKGPHCRKLVVSNPVHGTTEHTMITKGIKSHEMPRSKRHTVHTHRTHAGRLGHLERQFSEDETATDVEEVWFAGCHWYVQLLMLFRDTILMSIYADISGLSCQWNL
jgi:hypothetical protein